MKRFFTLISVFLLFAAGIAYYVWPKYSIDLPRFLSYELVQEIRNEIIQNNPLRFQGDYPNSVLTVKGVVDETNRQRREAGLPELVQNARLHQAAELKVKDMFDGQYFDHISPSGNGPSHFARQAGYRYVIIGENLALGNFKDDVALVEAWMNSQGHRENILNAQYQEIGVAVMKGRFEGKMVWLAVQEFGRPESACPSVSSSLRATIDAERDELDRLVEIINRTHSELSRSSPRTERERAEYNEKVREYNRLVDEYRGRSEKLKQNIERYNSQVRLYNQCISR
jgi:hypothetical protein